MRKSVRAFYIRIGNMPPAKAKAFIDKFKDEVLNRENSVYYEDFFFATQDESRVEVFP